MKIKLRFLALLAIFALLAFAATGWGKKPSGGGGTQNWVSVNAQFSPSFDGVDAKILGDDYGIYDSKIYASTGQFVLGTNGSRSALFVFDDYLGNASDACYDDAGNFASDLPNIFPDPYRLVLTGQNGLRVMTWREVFPATDSLGPYLNLLNMTPGETRYVQLDFVFNAPEADGMFMVRLGHTNDGGESSSIVQVTAYDDSGDLVTDRWMLKPIQDPDLRGSEIRLNQANLNQYLAITGGKYKLPARNCNHGDFVMPFELTITRVQ
jgi:hypothetical protein